MGRRDFLLLRRKGPDQVLELSCERLYMRWADARSGAGGLEATEPAGPHAWEGEPPTRITTASPAAVLAELDRVLAAADVLQLVDTEWMSDHDFAREIESRVEAFRVRGGRVE